MQSGIRSVVATLLLLAYARWKGIALFSKDGTLLAGVGAGILFASEFVLIYDAVNHITVSRLVVLVYCAPCLTALGLSIWVPGEKLVARQWAGIVLAFAGIVVAFGENFLASGKVTWRGDIQALLGALLWAATTVLIRCTSLASTAPAKTLFYQLAVSALLLPIASLAIGEAGIIKMTPIALASLAFQSVVVAFASYLVWFWLLSRYLAGRLSVFSFLTPLFGVAFGALLLNEPISLTLLIATALVGAGIALVNMK
jgi:drug/metabolite transporter (DMT)-like permease